MKGQFTVYPAQRNLLWLGWAGVTVAIGSVFFSLSWPLAWVATGFLAGSGLLAIVFGLIPPVEIHPNQMVQSKRTIAWPDVYQVKRLLWTPLVVRLTLSTRNEVLVVYSGNESSRAALLRDIQRYSRGAVIEGVPYREFWGADFSPGEEAGEPAPGGQPTRYPMLLPDDEAEVERLFQQLKSAGRIEPTNSSGEN